MSNNDYDDSDELLPPNRNQPPIHRKPGQERVSVPGAIIGGAVNVGILALIMAVPTLNIPFITPVFAGITLALMAGPAANIMSAFMRIGYVGRFTRHLGKLLESAAATWGFYSMWQQYPFAFSAIGLPASVDKWLPIVFAVFAGFSGLAGLRHFIGLLGGSRRRNRNHDEDDDLED